MPHSPRARLGCLLAALVGAAPAGAAVGPAGVRFDRDVAPLLARRCLDCHGGPAPKGGLDLSRRASAREAIGAGTLEDSLLWQRVRDGEMPPGKPLPAAEKALLRSWIASGGAWGSDPVDPYRLTTAARAGYDWWSLRPVRRPAPPTVRAGDRAHNPVDRFLLAGLEAKGLAPSPMADRRTLVRRLTFDLLGLPPGPEEVEAFVADDRPDAYERLVDRLLASPQHGERWGRHWLDVVRFGESDGFERDLPRLDAWPYRDWVVRALNHDTPYDEFARLQLAGDVLRPADAEATVATGFLVAGPHDIVVPASAAMRESMKQDELEDVVGTVSQTFLGLTAHCARCHDHKFDPLPQRDYYRLAAALGGVRHGVRSRVAPVQVARLERLRARAVRLRADLRAVEEPARRELLRGRGPAGPRPLAEWDFTRGPGDGVGGLDVALRGGATLGDGGLRLDGKGAYAATGPLGTALGEKTLEAWVRLDGLDQRGGGVLSVQTLDGDTFDAIVVGEQEPRRWMAGSESFRRTRPFGGPAEAEAARRLVRVVITYAADGTVTAFRDGVAYGKPYRAGVSSFAAGRAQVVFGLRHGTPGAGRMLAGVVARARLYDRALSAAEVARSGDFPAVTAADLLARLNPAARRRHGHLSDELRRTREEVRDLEGRAAQTVFANTPTTPGRTRLLIRGDVGSPGEVVSAEVVTALAGRLPATGLSPDAADDRRRAALAGWVADARNPLFARVMANRLWQYHFGVGLVDTPSDLGFNGGRPSHPELLDWLADELVRSGWSLKHLHRVLVTSAAYRQASAGRPDAARADADNRLVWRMSPRRLEAESLRDAVLAVSGDLDTRLGGEPYLDVRSYFFKGTQFYEPLEQVGAGFRRRSLYRLWARGGRNPLLDALDCPDPSATTPRRAVTSTPLQALTLFNNAFVLHQADRLGRRLRREAGPDNRAQARLAYRLALGREPTAAEGRLVVPFVGRHGAAALARVLFNTHEFMQID